TLTIRCTQPAEALVDPATGARRAGIDGVSGRIEALADGRWLQIATIELEPSTSSWVPAVAEVPAGATRGAVAFLARACIEYDTVMLALEPPRLGGLGTALLLLLRIGEWLALAFGFWIVAVLATPALAALGRLAAPPVPPPSRPISVGVRWALLIAV